MTRARDFDFDQYDGIATYPISEALARAIESGKADVSKCFRPEAGFKVAAWEIDRPAPGAMPFDTVSLVVKLRRIVPTGMHERDAEAMDRAALWRGVGRAVVDWIGFAIVIGALVWLIMLGSADGAELNGPPEPPAREDVIAASFPGFVSIEARESRMRTSKRVGIALFTCDAVSTFTAKGREINPWRFALNGVGVHNRTVEKVAGVVSSAVGLHIALRAEESALRRHDRKRANVVRVVRFVLLAGACGSNLRLSF